MHRDNRNPYVLNETESLCPECLTRIPASRVHRGDSVFFEKHCPEHGRFSTVCWREQSRYPAWAQAKRSSCHEKSHPPSQAGCPFDCGPCLRHRNKPCCVLLEVTERCDLGCSICFAGSGGPSLPDPDLATIRRWYQVLLNTNGPFNIQLSGGEPSLRDDLPEIIALGRSMGFTFFQINTNGIRLSQDAVFLGRLKKAGLSTVYLQFDGTDDTVFTRLRGKRLLSIKQQAIEQCARQYIGIVLVATLVPGINTHLIGDIIRFGIAHSPAVRGVHFQPISYFGRYHGSPTDSSRFTLPEVMTAIVEQTDGLVKAQNLKPPSSEHPLCSFNGSFIVLPDNTLHALSRSADGLNCCTTVPYRTGGADKARRFVARTWSYPEQDCTNGSIRKSREGCSLGDWDMVLERAQTHSFTISGMAFQDAWTLDLDRLRYCHLFTMSRDDRLVPFCAYNVTARSGASLYRSREALKA